MKGIKHIVILIKNHQIRMELYNFYFQNHINQQYKLMILDFILVYVLYDIYQFNIYSFLQIYTNITNSKCQ